MINPHSIVKLCEKLRNVIAPLATSTYATNSNPHRLAPTTPSHLKDNWLEAMGFKTGQAITITVKTAN
ncbi:MULTISPECIES: SymE family type I addiction module toxin [unclassified Gilliamella]|uniref:SymE family type I addiction module toxin n=1 Tax=unclassified Gilliamella TaxID=2685620 RepID=UPI003A5D1A35|nr:SymE family type I addiction module toxin [Gilliamella sp. B3372]MCX8595568.1 SymE family type I addiction module toxin [Gilliamella sp. B3367]